MLAALAENLGDAEIRAAVPDADPAEVRKILRELAGRFRPAVEGDSRSAADAVPDAAVLFTDGASRGNPGEAGAGAVLTGPDGREIASGRWYLGRVTNNAAEYLALIHGLEEAAARGIKRLEVRMDSELVVRQLNGRYRVKDAGLKKLFSQVQELRQRFSRITFTHVRREQNRRADRLANEAIDRKGR